LRSCAGPTGQVGAPACQLLPSCAAVTVVALATNTSGTTAAWLVGDGAGTGWPIAVGGEAVGRPAGDGRTVGRPDDVGRTEGLGVAVGVGLGVGLGVRLATAAGADEAMMGNGLEAGACDDGDDEDAAGLETADPVAVGDSTTALPPV
jgi:hypothetical protein